MNIDPRYSSVRLHIEAGHIHSIQEIFTYIPKTTVYKDLGINFNRFDRAIIDTSIFKLEELFKLADLINVDAKILVDMAYVNGIKIWRKKGNPAKEVRSPKNFVS